MDDELEEIIKQYFPGKKTKQVSSRKKGILSEYFSVSSLLGGALGTSLAYWGTLIFKSAYDLLFVKSSLIFQELYTGNFGSLATLLQADYWGDVGKAAFAGGLVGLILTTRLKKWILSHLGR